MSQENKIREVSRGILKCQLCPYKKYPIILTLHHIFPKNLFLQQPPFPRKYRYLLICPNCHALINKEIYVPKLKRMIKERLDECEKKYNSNDNLAYINKCKDIYNIE